MENSNLKFRLVINLDSEDWHGLSTETVWATKIEEKYRIENYPLYAKGISYGDLVFGHSIGDNLIQLDSIFETSGNSTYRVLYGQEVAIKAQALLKKLKDLGCGFEGGEINALNIATVNIPEKVNADRAWKIIKSGLDSEVWEVEEGVDRHPES